METKIKFSIQTKLLILLVTLPLVCLSLYLLLVFDLFKKDKIAYIFDTSVAVSRTLSSQVKSELKSLASDIRPILSGFQRLDGSFDKVSNDIFLDTERVKGLYVVEGIGDQYQVLGRLLKAKANEEKYKFDLIRNEEFLSQVVSDRIGLLSADSKTADFWYGFRVDKGSTDKALLAVALVTSEDLVNGFKGKSVYSSFLINEEGLNIINSRNYKGASQQPFRKWPFFKGLSKKVTREGAQETVSPKNEKWLMSYSKVGIGDLFVITLIEESQALSAISVLMKKSVLFFISLLSFAMLISIFASKQVTTALRKVAQATAKVAKGDFDLDLQVKSRDEVGVLAQAFNKMAQEIQQLLVQTAEKGRMESELKTAQTVQETLFPPNNHTFDKINVAGYYQPASECGGDWWYYNEVDDKVFLWIGDATGHGAPAALMTSAAKATVSVLSESKRLSPARALTTLNSVLYGIARGKVCMTFFACCYDRTNETFTYSNAGHEPPLVFRGDKKPLKRKDVEPLTEANGPRLGDRSDSRYEETQVSLEKGDTILFYTDGITDLVNEEGKTWQERNLIKTAIQYINENETFEKMPELLVQEINEFRGQAELYDDVTFFFARYESKDPIKDSNKVDEFITEKKKILNPEDGSELKTVNLNNKVIEEHFSENDVAFHSSRSPNEILDFITDQKLRHIINIDDVYSIKHVNFAKCVLEEEENFFKDPIKFYRNVLTHEFDKEEIFDGPITGFERLLDVEFKSKDQKDGVLKNVEEFLSQIPGALRIFDNVRMVVDELFTNALYHGGEAASRIFIFCTQKKAFIACEDNSGSLEISQLMNKLKSTYASELSESVNLDRSKGTAGIGFRLIFDKCDSLSIGVHKQDKTFIALSLPLNHLKYGSSNAKTIHLIERT